MLKGLGGLIPGPAFTIISAMASYISGSQSGFSAFLNLALTGFINTDGGLADLGYEVEPSPPLFF